MTGAPPAVELATLEHVGPGVLLSVPAGQTVALPLVWLRLARPGGGPATGARAAVVVHRPPPQPTDTLALVTLGAGIGAATAAAAGAAPVIAGPATVVVETDCEPPYGCEATVRLAWAEE